MSSKALRLPASVFAAMSSARGEILRADANNLEAQGIKSVIVRTDHVRGDYVLDYPDLLRAMADIIDDYHRVRSIAQEAKEAAAANAEKLQEVVRLVSGVQADSFATAAELASALRGER